MSRRIGEQQQQFNKKRKKTFIISQILSPIICLVLGYYVQVHQGMLTIHSYVLFTAAIFYIAYGFLFTLPSIQALLYKISCLQTLFLIAYYTLVYPTFLAPALPWLSCIPAILIYFLDGRFLTFSKIYVSALLIIMIYTGWQKMHTTQLVSGELVFLLTISAATACIYSFYMAYAIRNLSKKNEAHLRYLSETDPMTEILNRRSFIQQTKMLLSLHYQKHHSFTVFMLDIDNFKQINDNYGHDVGDTVILDLVDTIKLLLRQDDLFARMGGEEFAIFLTNTNKMGALRVAKRIFTQIEQNKVLTLLGEPIDYSISIGSYIYSETEYFTIDQILKAADTALYQAKTTGKARLVNYVDSTQPH